MLDRTSCFRGVAGKEGMTLIRQGLQFSHKNKLKSEIFNDSKDIKYSSKTFFFVITKNSNWEILPKNLVTFKDKMVLRMKNFNIFGVH